MNERIRHIERESGLEIYGLGAKRDMWEATMEKFTELVVKECVNAMTEYGKTYAYPSAGEYQSGEFSKVIKKHFGIKE